MKIFAFVFLFVICEVSSKVLPDYVSVCKRKDPEFVKCVLASVDKIKPYLLKGIPEMKVPPYEPLEIPRLTIDRNLDSLRVKAVVEKMKIHGASGFKLKNLKIDLDKLTAELKVTLPHIFATCEYQVAGRLLAIPLAGKGIMRGNFTDSTAVVKGSAKIVKKKGVEHLQLDKFNSKIRVGGGRVKFVDNGNNALIAETAAAFFNANPRLVLDITNPIVEDTSKALFTAYINRILAAVPLSELLPED